MNETGLPRYRDLPDGDAVGLFGADDVLGSLNRLTPDRVRDAASLVRTGERYGLNAPLTWPDPPLYDRTPLRHTIYRTRLGNRDDYLDGFYPQASSQWDAFPHIEDPDVGFYNRQAPEHLGVDGWSRAAIIGRGVLLDAESYFAELGTPLHWRTARRISVDDVRNILDAQAVAPQEGDIVLLRTGWTKGYESASDLDRQEVVRDQTSPGLEGSPQMLELLWDWGVSAIASDNVSVEVLPPGEFTLHSHLLNRLGIPIGELWWLDDLAAACARDGRYDFMVVSVPLNLPGGIGSPANAVAIR